MYFSSFFQQVVLFAGVLIILLAQWTGVIAIATTRRGGAWWAMLAGAVVPVITMAAWYLVPLATRSFSSLPTGTAYQVINAVQTVGNILFFTGFAIHAFGVCRMSRRIKELETIAGVQASELDALRNPRG